MSLHVKTDDYHGPDRRGSRTTPVILYLILILLVLLTVAGVRAGVVLHDQSNETREAAILNCESLNTVIDVQRGIIARDIRQTEQTDPALFPQIPPEEFQKLIDEAVKRQLEDQGMLVPIDCESRFE